MQDRIASTESGRAWRQDVTQGLLDIWPIVVATIPFGMVFGTVASAQGLSFTDSVLMSALMFAGLAQFTALELWVHPLPFVAIVLSVLAVNLRLVLYGAAMGRRIGHWSAPARYTGISVITDPTIALVELRGGQRLSGVYYAAVALPIYVNWVVMTGIGYFVGSLIDDPQAIGLDFVVFAYFVHVLLAFRGRPGAIWVILASAAASVVTYATVGSPWHFASGAAAGIAIAAATAKPDGATA